MTAGVAIALGLLPVAFFGAKAAMVVGLTVRGIVSWLLEEPEGVKGALARIVVVAMLLRSIGAL